MLKAHLIDKYIIGIRSEITIQLNSNSETIGLARCDNGIYYFLDPMPPLIDAKLRVIDLP